MILAYIEKHNNATTADIAESFDLSKDYVRRILREMASDKMIEKIGGNRDAYYVLKE